MTTGIYMIINQINGHSYIGQSINIEERWREHKSVYSWNREKNKPLYKAFQKYGVDNFSFVILEECDMTELNDKEIYWIAKYDTYHNGYNLTPGGRSLKDEDHPRHKLTRQDVIDIRTRYGNRERKKDVYQDYCDRIGESGFSKIWKGTNWLDVMPEVYTPENKYFHAHNTANKGSTNGRARLTEDEVRDIRLRRKNGENIRKVYEDYSDKLTYGSFVNVWSYQNWKEIVV